MTEDNEQLAAVFREGFLQQVRLTMDKLGQDEGLDVIRQALLAYVVEPLDGEVIEPDSPLAGLDPAQRAAVSQAAADVLAMIEAEAQLPS